MQDPREIAAALDRADPLARWREEFRPPAGTIYLDGNSLGPLSDRAAAAITRVTAEWRALGIGGWLSAQPPWLGLSELIAASLAPVVGADADEIAVTGSTTANLHQLLATLYDPAAPRRVVVADELNFPSDLHAIASQLRLRGLDPASHLRLVRSRDGRTLATADILAALGDDTQLLLLPSVLFVSGQLLDLPTVTRAARDRGVLVGWDLSHSVGVVPHNLGAIGADFACWCSYKYLNAGPGAVGGLYLNRRHFGRPPGLAGWWGVRPDRRFAMRPDHEPAAGAAALQVGTPHLLSLAPLEATLGIIAEAGGVTALRTKSLSLTDLLIAEAERQLAPWGVTVATPRDASGRGGHVALAFPQAWQACQALQAAGVIADCRPPDILRLAPSPLFNSHADCVEAVARLAAVLRSGAHSGFPASPALVT